MRLTALAFVILLAAWAPARLGAAPREQTLLICHPTGSKDHRYALVRVPVSSVRARLRHGDVLPADGRCP